MEVNKEELRRLAEAATPGPWRECGADRGGCACGQVWSISLDCPVAEVWQGDDVIGEPEQGAMANAAFIAKANPAAIISLLDENAQLRAENERLRAQLAESQANDRTAMGYLAEVRAVVGGDDFPGMVRNVKALRKDAERWYAAYENDVDLGMNGEEFVDWLVEKSKAPADI